MLVYRDNDKSKNKASFTIFSKIKKNSGANERNKLLDLYHHHLLNWRCSPGLPSHLLVYDNRILSEKEPNIPSFQKNGYNDKRATGNCYDIRIRSVFIAT